MLAAAGACLSLREREFRETATLGTSLTARPAMARGSPDNNKAPSAPIPLPRPAWTPGL
ncbi:protein of unknown function [Cupriavidus taiwanensis]|nr:protein of unknown function [Cupriavidus taiwanensis]